MRKLKSTIKSIVRRYGVRAIWQSAGGASVDLQSGDKTDNMSPFPISKVLILPETITEKFTYDLSYIAANKSFTSGGFYTQGSRSIAVLKSNLSTYSIDDRVKIEGTTYRIKQAFDNPNGFWGFNLTDIKNVNDDS